MRAAASSMASGRPSRRRQISTTVAAFYDHFLGWVAPYPLLSWPVMLGTVGGIMLVIGTSGMLYLKSRSDRQPADTVMVAMDVAFLLALLLTSLTGLLLLALRDTPAMGAMLAIHLGLVAALFRKDHHED